MFYSRIGKTSSTYAILASKYSLIPFLDRPGLLIIVDLFRPGLIASATPAPSATVAVLLTLS